MKVKAINKKIFTMFATLLVAFSIFTIQPKAATTTPGSAGQRVMSWVENFNGEDVRFNCLITTGTEQANTSTSLGTGNTQSYKTINIYVSADKPVNGELYMVVTLDNTYSGTRYTYNVGCMFANGWGFAEYQTNEVAQLPYDMYPYDLQKGSVAIESISTFNFDITDFDFTDYMISNNSVSNPQLWNGTSNNWVNFSNSVNTRTFRMSFDFNNYSSDNYYLFELPYITENYSDIDIVDIYRTTSTEVPYDLNDFIIYGHNYQSGIKFIYDSTGYFYSTNYIVFRSSLSSLWSKVGNSVTVYEIPKFSNLGNSITNFYNKEKLNRVISLLYDVVDHTDEIEGILNSINTNTVNIKNEVTGIKGIVQAILDHLTGSTDNPVNDKTQGIDQKTQELQNSVNTVDSFENSTINQMDSNFNAVNINSPSYKGIFGQMIETTNFYRDYLEGINSSVTSSSYVSFIWIIPLILMVVLFFLGA